jgi:hypothetical protein
VFHRLLTKKFAAVARNLEAKPVVFRGIVSGTDCEAFKQQLQQSGLSARIWWDPDHDGKSGPLRSAWGALSPNVYVIDAKGMIRYSELRQVWVLEKAVAAVLKEMEGQNGDGQKAE